MKEKNIALILIVLCSLAVLISLFKTKTAVKDNSTLDSDIISNAISAKKIKVLALDGMIFDSISSSSSPFKSHFDAATLKRDLIDAIKDENVKAIMLRVNSPVPKHRCSNCSRFGQTPATTLAGGAGRRASTSKTRRSFKTTGRN